MLKTFKPIIHQTLIKSFQGWRDAQEWSTWRSRWHLPVWTSLCFTADLWTESQQQQQQPPQPQQQQFLWPAPTTIATASHLHCQFRQNLWYPVRPQLSRSKCEARRIRRREKLTLAQNWCFWFKLIRAKYWACINQKETANRGTDVSTPNLSLPVLDLQLKTGRWYVVSELPPTKPDT